MSNMSLGITAMELFACNPYRVLGVAVNTPEDKLTEIYRKLVSMAQRGTVRDYKTEFDFSDSLPPFERTEASLKTAFAKLASNGYRCFAYADGQFSAALNVDDVMLNLRDITCYDCFLRCYMWLITNDRQFEEPELWISLCKYIDKMIMSDPSEWQKYFDHRFPEKMIDASLSVYRSFYATFCELILLPIKELARGSMKCRNAMDILRIAGVDVAEEFEYIEIPQANIPQPGQPAPLLKIAVKDGDEYFDVRTGKMVSFKSDSNAVESNQFEVASTAISADAIVSDEEPADLKLPRAHVLGEFKDKSSDTSESAEVRNGVPEEPLKTNENPVVSGVDFGKPEAKQVSADTAVSADINNAKVDVSNLYAKTEPADKAVMPKREINKTAERLSSAESEPKQSVLREQNTYSVQENVRHVEEIVSPIRRNKVVIPNSSIETNTQSFSGAQAETGSSVQPKPFVQSSAAPVAGTPLSGSKKPFKRSAKTLTSLVEQTDDFINESISLTEDINEDENDYTKALIEMLRANRSSHQMMKDVDTRHVYDNGDSLGSPDDAKLSMDSINMNKYDKTLLGYTISPDETDPKKLRDEKYKNINISDMLNPTLGRRVSQRTFEPDAIQEYKSEKVKSKKTRSAMFKLALVLGFVVLLYLILFFMGII